MIAARILNKGTVIAPVLHLDAPLSFWGGFDPQTGRIVDVHHPQHGVALTGKIVLMAYSRGSGTAPGALAEAIRLATGPEALIMVESDVNLAIGAQVAATLYGRSMPVLTVTAEDFAIIASWPAANIAPGGAITPASP
jgi:predicted aconitase with swiveling domain